MTFKVVIVGAGLAGALLANGLLNNDIEFDIYESDYEGAPRDGYQIRLGAPSLAGFKACLTQGRRDKLMPKFGRTGGLISSAPMLYDVQLNLLLDLTKFPAYTKSAPIGREVLREFLLETLTPTGKLHCGKRFQHYEVLDAAEEGKRTKIEVHFEDGWTDECDVLIGAEGSRSTVRLVNEQVSLNNIVQLRNNWGFLAKTSLPPARLASLPSEALKSPLTIINDGIILFFSVYLPDGIASVVNETDPKHSTTHAYDEATASIFWGLSVPKDKVPDDNGRAIKDKLGFCMELIKDWDPRIRAMLESVDNDSIHVFQARASTTPPKDWRGKAKSSTDPRPGNDQVWLIGDAMHPMLPARGMGGNQAMRDTADALPLLIRLAEKAQQNTLTDAEYSAAVSEYEALVIPRAFGWVRKSGGLGRQLTEPTSVKGRIMLFFVARALDLAYVYGLIRSALGYKPRDDAPELPD